MPQPLLGEVRMFASVSPPPGWAAWDGQRLPIAGNEALMALVGTAYSGDSTNTFALPVQPGQAPGGDTYNPGQQGNRASATLATAGQSISSLSLGFIIALIGEYPVPA